MGKSSQPFPFWEVIGHGLILNLPSLSRTARPGAIPRSPVIESDALPPDPAMGYPTH
jgi:hypothetical protein